MVIACLVFGKDLAAPGPLLAALFGLTPGAALKNPGRPELAGYYGNLAGFDVLRSARLDLIGWQIKASRVTRTAEGTQIDLWLGGERFDHGPFTIEDHE